MVKKIVLALLISFLTIPVFARGMISSGASACVNPIDLVTGSFDTEDLADYKIDAEMFWEVSNFEKSDIYKGCRFSIMAVGNGSSTEVAPGIALQAVMGKTFSFYNGESLKIEPFVEAGCGLKVLPVGYISTTDEETGETTSQNKTTCSLIASPSAGLSCSVAFLNLKLFVRKNIVLSHQSSGFQGGISAGLCW